MYRSPLAPPFVMDPIKEFGKIVLSLDNCIIPNERLLNTPSSRDGVGHELETDLRIVGCEYVQCAGLMLKLPQVKRQGMEGRLCAVQFGYRAIKLNYGLGVSLC